MNKTKNIVVIFLLVFIIGSLAGIFGYWNAKITTFEECEDAGWLVRSITVYDGFGYIEKECVLWSGKSFVKQRTQEEENSLKIKCCEECKTAFSKSPVGFGPEMAMCGKFNSGYPISASCELFFENNPMSVSSCESYLKTKPQDSSVASFFPTQKEPANLYMEALLSDKPEELELVDGCFRVNNGYDNYLIVWPYGFSLSADENGVIQVIDNKGQPVARVGDKVRFGGGGGEMSGGDSGNISTYSEQLPSIRCSGPYWILGEIIKLKELTGDQKRAVEIAVAHLSYPTTIVEVKKLECYGCFSITLQRDDNQQQFTITLNDWKITN